LALYFAISFNNDTIEFVYILIMCHFSYDVTCFYIDMNYDLNFEKLKVIRFMLGLNGSLRARFKGLMPQTLHDVVLKAVELMRSLRSTKRE
jgi:hypothetical protein